METSKMDIGHIGGNDRIDRGLQQPGKVVRSDKEGGQQSESGSLDSTDISSTGREVARSVEGLGERLYEDREVRVDLVAAAKQRLDSGALDKPEVFRKAAEGLLAEGF